MMTVVKNRQKNHYSTAETNVNSDQPPHSTNLIFVSCI